ncbi:YafY family transcriptional regulator [Mucilaginibacter sp. HMF5004]|uniref:helix-turn-helix transcriptional regulator n=1 Tax=Mucilaginibacter rivuli TaxID=2857527 RepID=UPI001C607351|nr:YafY family protein [Mucilaginibacter rivuli]MBW4891930.1 YafY family transcriptional regulator [Mucilaginibacter rivuli]
MNRIDRITAILIQLQSRRVVKAQDIADRFSISLRTVYRDVKTLEEAGIPIIGEAGVGYSIMDGYRLPPVMFTKEEATAFLTAEKFMEKLTDTSTEESYKSAMYKVRAVLRTADKDFLDQIDHRIEVIKSRRSMNSRPDNNLIQDILKGISEKRVLSLQYFAHHSQQHSKRNVEPVGIFYADNFWHMIAWCRLRGDYRDFRIDRMQSLEVTDTVFKGQHPTLKEYLGKIGKENDLQTIIIRVEKSIITHINEQKFYMGFVSEIETENYIEMTFLTCSIEGFAHWYMMFGYKAQIVCNDLLRTKVADMAELIHRQLSETEFAQ